MNDDTIIITGISGDVDPIFSFGSERCNSVVYIYKNRKLLKKLSMEQKLAQLQSQLHLCNDEIIISNYYNNSQDSQDNNNTNDVYVIREYESSTKWRGEYILNMNKVELIITGEIFSNNGTPRFTLTWPSLQLPKMRPNFYYKDIPLITFNIYNIENNSYITILTLSDIIFTQQYLQFSLSGPIVPPYNYNFILTISYIL